jgi:3-hydroxyisobutyrate dehydrogenase-like beta-hydroxyacid dehydrogenase
MAKIPAGAPVARNLIKAGFAVTAHNRSRGKVEELVRHGAADGGSPAGVARASDVILLCLPDTPDVEQVLFSRRSAGRLRTSATAAPARHASPATSSSLLAP